MRSDVLHYSLGGQGCTSGIIEVELAAHLLRVRGPAGPWKRPCAAAQIGSGSGEVGAGGAPAAGAGSPQTLNNILCSCPDRLRIRRSLELAARLLRVRGPADPEQYPMQLPR